MPISVILLLTSCTFFSGSLEQDDRLFFFKIIHGPSNSTHFHGFENPFDLLACIEPPLNAPRIRHTAFEICLAYANLAIDDQGYKSQLEKAMELEHSALLAQIAFTALSISGIPEERAEEIRRLIYDLYGAELSPKSDTELSPKSDTSTH